MAVGLAMATTCTCADMPVIEMVADRHGFYAAVMLASRLSSTSQRAAPFLIQ